MAWERLKWTLSRWSLSRWLLFARLLQVSSTLITAVMNGFLLVYIHVNHLGLAMSMFCLEMMACVALIYSGIVLLMQHGGSPRRRFNTGLIATFVAGDIVFNGMMLAIITVLAHSGLPTDCHGLTRTDMEDGDAPFDDPSTPGFETTRFGDVDQHIKGQLDKYCPLERGFYFIAAALVFTYMLTVTLGVLRIFERRWSQGRKDTRFASIDDIQLHHIQPKSPPPLPPRDMENAAPPTEGVLTPTSRVNPPLQTQGFGSSENVGLHRERPIFATTPSQPFPISPVSPASPMSQVSPISPTTHQHRSFIASTGVPGTSMGDVMMNHSTDPAAEAAMITDGYRHQPQPGMSSLPPYSPGQSRGQFMDGHGNESNEMRLSEYVKGETRAQNIKDTGFGI
ncbi:uncharacterized protein F4822DRAFT_293660 [Hypoxylon trugodes]|uniref:uncharacterized protein n=1 Tax=Hypoxylon trugodes TaxID=326681 RepID=UPI0021921D61|nr:uncharacterized protein F4822DRAFT_293660 [Hypoxylon trugodes]KAI1387832.1 hypothetical protein F4822DRAFT_293660 [Hypoxylon trugodes]